MDKSWNQDKLRPELKFLKSVMKPTVGVGVGLGKLLFFMLMYLTELMLCTILSTSASSCPWTAFQFLHCNLAYKCKNRDKGDILYRFVKILSSQRWLPLWVWLTWSRMILQNLHGQQLCQDFTHAFLPHLIFPTKLDFKVYLTAVLPRSGKASVKNVKGRFWFLNIW